MSLRSDAEKIWWAGVDAVRPEKLFPRAISLDNDRLTITDARQNTREIDLANTRKVWVVGGGKAGAGMSRGLVAALGERFLEEKQLRGLLSVPEDCLDSELSGPIQWVAGRPPGVNEPRPEGEAAAREMLRIVASADPSDLVVCLLSGGGSALLPAPSAPVTLTDKIAIARLLSERGATIEQLNTVRQQLSDIKGGGLARACKAGTLLTLCISDVLGDPIDLIASGPTVVARSTPRDALSTLDHFDLLADAQTARVVKYLRSLATSEPTKPTSRCEFLMLANNAAAVDAAGAEAERLGYNHAMQSASSSEGSAEGAGRHLAEVALSMRDSPDRLGPNCLISGGEPTVELAPKAIRGRGGRNQQLVLAASETLGDCRGVALLSGGTDGEDGPTDAAGAVIDPGVTQAAEQANLNAQDTLRRNDAYTYFQACGGLLRTGPTNTNVCDLRVVTVEKGSRP